MGVEGGVLPIMTDERQPVEDPPRRPESVSAGATRRALLISLATAAAAVPALTVLRSAQADPRAPQQPTPSPPGRGGAEPAAPSPPPLSPAIPAEPAAPATPPALRSLARANHPLLTPPAVGPIPSAVSTGPSNISVQDNSSGAALSVEQDGTGAGIYVTKPSDPNAAVWIDAYGSGLVVQHTQDWQGAVMDLTTFRHRATGDAIFVEHRGGLPPGSTQMPGGNAGLSILIPYYLDSLGGDGRTGTQLNDRTGMNGINIDVQAPNAGVDGIVITFSGQGSALFISSQYPGYPQGNGHAVVIDHAGTGDAVVLYNTGPGVGLHLFSSDATSYPIVVRNAALAPLLSLSPSGQLATRNGFLAAAQPSTFSQVLGSYVQGDGALRYLLTADGRQAWGPGVGGFDVTLYRSQPGAIRYTGILEASTDKPAHGPAFRTRASAGWAYTLQTDGRMQWGPGDYTYDVTLERAAPGVLRLTDSRLGYSASQTATTVGGAGAAAPVPASPDGYLIIDVDGQRKKIPYFSDTGGAAPTPTLTPTPTPTSTSTSRPVPRGRP